MSRFLPSYEFSDPMKPGRVEVTVNGPQPTTAQARAA